MTAKHRFYATCLIAVFAAVTIGIGYATGMLSMQKRSTIVTENVNTPETTQTAIDTPKTAVKVTKLKKKNCSCCAERRAKVRERRARILAKKQAEKNGSTTVIVGE